MTVDELLERWLREHGDELVAVRRHLHAHPELSWDEHDTTRFVAERLELAGLAPKALSSGTGLLCDIEPASADARDAPAVALRADIDALAMDDEKDVHYRSQRPGAAHACGHDVHTTATLGAGLFLAHHRDHLTRPVRLVFQPAEEKLPGGALVVIGDGGLDGIAAIYGLHCDPKIDVGKVGLAVGPISSAADRLELGLRGPGGHTARPEQTVDMVRLVATLALEVPRLVALHASALDDGDHAVKVVFGSLHSGDASNVIPTHAVLRGSVRTPSMVIWDALPQIVERAVDHVLAEATAWMGADVVHELVHVRGVPPVVNDPEATTSARGVLARALGEHAVGTTAQSWGGDDFAWYLRHVPGTFVRLGVHDPSRAGRHFDLHVADFDVDERSIAVGVKVLVSLATT